MKDILLLLLDFFLDSLKSAPFLFLAYLLVEYVEHKDSLRLTNFLLKFRSLTPLVGSFIGLVPQCGVAVSVIRLFVGGLISAGTLLAVLIATSDEALLVLFATHGFFAKTLILILIKTIIAALCGSIYDLIFKKGYTQNTEAMHDEMHSHCEDDCCEQGLFITALKHTIKSWAFIFLSLTVFGYTLYYIGEDTFSALLMSGSILQPLLTSLVGLIPGCAPSIMLSSLYISSSLSFGSLVAGLISNSGIGLVFLFKTNKNIKQNILFTLLLIILGTLVGQLLQIFNIFA